MLTVLVLAAGLHAVAPPPRPAIEFLGSAALPGDARDRSRLYAMLGGRHPHNRLGSFGSGIDFTGGDDRYLACNDRGPGDGAFDYRCRVQLLRIQIDPSGDSASRISVELLKTTLLSDSASTPLRGLSAALDPASEPQSHIRYDPEGIRLFRPAPGIHAPPGSFYLSDEYGPSIDLFDPDGRRLKRLAVPARFTIAAPAADPELELPPRNTSGRQPNRGFEGLALSPDGQRLYAILQSPLIQDGGLDDDHNRVGRNIRVLELPVDGRAKRELIYPLDNSRHGVSEIEALDSSRLLVLERDGKGGTEARFRKVFLTDSTHATDVSHLASIPARALPPDLKPLAKRPLIDLLDPAFGLAGPNMPEKIEGLTLGPTLADGRRAIIITTDNDLKPEQPSWIWVFAAAPSTLAPHP